MHRQNSEKHIIVEPFLEIIRVTTCNTIAKPSQKMILQALERALIERYRGSSDGVFLDLKDLVETWLLR